MKTYIAILRGINVSGKNIIRMAELAELLKGIGFENVQTYIQSGNVIFNYHESAPEVITATIQKMIFENFQFRVPVIVLTFGELEIVIAGNPFIDEPTVDKSKLHVTFLSKIPDLEKIEKALQILNPPDEIHAGEKAFYIYCPGGYGRTKFNNGFFEKKLGTIATTRNWNTTLELLRLAKNNNQ